MLLPRPLKEGGLSNKYSISPNSEILLK